MTGNSLGRHTRSEIFSQPETWQATVKSLAGLSCAGLPDPSAYDQVLFIGCGSTFYLALWAARQCQEMYGTIARAAPASDILLFPASYLSPKRRTLLVAVSRSAETTETVRAVQAFRAGDYGDTLAIVCYPDRHLAQLTDWVIGTPSGQEQSIAQTRSFTNMMIAACRFLRAEAHPSLGRSLAAAAEGLLNSYQGLAAQLGRDAGLDRFFFLGSGPLYGLACEAMLKMKEMSLSYAEAYHFLEFRHGPMSMVDSMSLVVGLLAEQAQEHELAVLQEMRGLGARTLALAAGPPEPPSPAAEAVVSLGLGLPPAWRAALYLPFLQLLAWERAVAKGVDPDRPTHLTSVVRLDV